MNSKQAEKFNVLPILCIVFAVMFGVMLFAVLRAPKRQTAEFTPPPFEPAAVQGTPDLPESSGYSSPYKDGMTYRFSICGNVISDGADAVVYLTNPAGNEVWIKVRIMDEGGNTLGESGLLKPGEYVKSVHLESLPDAGAKIRLKIMGYEPETYYSAGSVTLNTNVGGNAE